MAAPSYDTEQEDPYENHVSVHTRGWRYGNRAGHAFSLGEALQCELAWLRIRPASPSVPPHLPCKLPHLGRAAPSTSRGPPYARRVGDLTDGTFQVKVQYSPVVSAAECVERLCPVRPAPGPTA